MHQKLTSLPLPKLGRAIDEDTSFKLTVHLHSASIPGLQGSGGLISRERPRVEVVLAGSGARKETELGVRRTGCDRVSEESNDFPWHFGESLTFTASMADILGPGLQVWLRTESNIQLGSLLSVNLASSAADSTGVASLDLLRQVLPACSQKVPDGPEMRGSWGTPVMTLPMTCVSLSSRPDMCALGEAAAHVKLACSVSIDPEVLLQAADVATRPLLDRVTAPVLELVHKAEGGLREFASDADRARKGKARELLDKGWLAYCRAATACDCGDMLRERDGEWLAVAVRDYGSPRSDSSSDSSPSSSDGSPSS
jgi:hypothetical protein